MPLIHSESLERCGVIFHQSASVHVQAYRSSSSSRGHRQYFAIKSYPVDHGDISDRDLIEQRIQHEYHILQQLKLSQTTSDVTVSIAKQCLPLCYGLYDFDESLNQKQSKGLILSAGLGGKLSQHIYHQSLSIHHLRVYTFELIQVLLYLQNYTDTTNHTQKRNVVIHRDLKPQNIMLTHTGHIQVIDFAFSKCLHDSEDRTFTILGTYPYMAPEMVARDVGYNASIDWWAVGIILYEMLTRTLPKLTWYQTAQDSRNGCKEKLLISAKQSLLAKEAILSNQPQDNAWHYNQVDDLMDYYPCPNMPHSGDILNHIHIIEQRMEHEEVQHARDLLLKLLEVNPNKRWPIHNPEDILQHPWLLAPKQDGNGNLIPLEIDTRLGHVDHFQHFEQKEEISQTCEEKDVFADF